MPEAIALAEAGRRFEDFILRAEFGGDIVILRYGATDVRFVGMTVEGRRASFEKTVERIRVFGAPARSRSRSRKSSRGKTMGIADDPALRERFGG